jgi:site-specific DNA-methyltransferase (adenine-specific)
MADFELMHGDCLLKLKTLPERSVNLVVTSPPYAKQRHKTYGGIRPDGYVEWFLEIALEIKRVLTDDGSFILNIKENCEDGQRSLYVYKLVIALVERQGWFWVEEYPWHKKTSTPGYWPNRLRDAWEHCYHFTKSKSFKMYQEAIKKPVGDWYDNRMRNLSDNDQARRLSNTKSGFGVNLANFNDKKLVLPDNVLFFPAETANKNHSAVFPEALPEFFIKLFSEEGDTVLDPFGGSGTTGVVALRYGRKVILIEKNGAYLPLIRERLDGVQIVFNLF